ncbi:MAG: class I SAM-dependent methyltransferase [Candidatus Hermodarchaeota archaeon]
MRELDAIKNSSIDFIFSNDLFCDLDRVGLEKALNEFYRVLKTEGQMAHAEYSSAYENISQKLFIEADMHSLETSLPKPTWFSPYSDELAALMHKVGFKDITVRYLETGLHLEFNDAIAALKNWTADPLYIENHKEDLRKHRIETPLEHVIFCVK